MENNKIIRSICVFSAAPSNELLKKLSSIEASLANHNFIIQTKRICTKEKSIQHLCESISDPSLYLSVGTLSTVEANQQFSDFLKYENAILNIDLTQQVTSKDVDFLFRIIKQKPSKTFCFTYVFNNVPSSPFFPSGAYEKDGFSIGLQPTDLAENCKTIEEWLKKLKQVWHEIYEIFQSDHQFLGIDSSIAPLFHGKSSFVNFLRRIKIDFSHAATTNTYLEITEFIKKENPKPIGLCGLMLPCLEDFELAEEYEKSNFSIERNIYLSLHSGLGIDTYPIGINESPQRVLEVLQLIRDLSNKYKKPLSARFVSDGKAKIGEKTDFHNPYLKDVVVRPL